MPSRKEIVEWLREDADNFEMIGTEFLGKKTLTEYAEKMRQRAAQVSSMRCETCKHYDKQHQLCEVVGGSELLIPGYFGCFFHEQKPAD